MTGGGATGSGDRWGEGRRAYRSHGEVGWRDQGLQGPWGGGMTGGGSTGSVGRWGDGRKGYRGTGQHV